MFGVMLVDDENDVITELKNVIDWDQMGFYIAAQANDGLEALNMLDKKHVDLIITDIKMPNMDGIELLKEIKRNSLCACVIILSRQSNFEYAQQGLVCGAFDYILKPVNSQKITASLNRAYKYIEDQKLEQSRNRLFEKLLNRIGSMSNDTSLINLLDDWESLHSKYLFEHHENMEEKGRFLSSLIVNGNSECLKVINEIFANAWRSGRSDLNTLHKELTKILEDVSTQLSSKYTALNKICNISEISKLEFEGFFNINDIKESFVSTVTGILKLLSEYYLNHGNKMINSVCEFVLSNVDEDITLKSLSNQFYISPNYFSHLFKEQTGENFQNYISRVKIGRAKYLLKTPNFKAYEVGNMLGYSEPAYFSRLFRKHAGCYPTEYRKYCL